MFKSSFAVQIQKDYAKHGSNYFKFTGYSSACSSAIVLEWQPVTCCQNENVVLIPSFAASY